SHCPDGGGGGRWPVGVGSGTARAAGAAGAGRRREPRGGSAAGSAPQAGSGGGCSRIRERCWWRRLAQPVPEAAVGPEGEKVSKIDIKLLKSGNGTSIFEGYLWKLWITWTS
ncbi:Hypothetical predicted protein, partial [Marmota monax]